MSNSTQSSLGVEELATNCGSAAAIGGGREVSPSVGGNAAATRGTAPTSIGNIAKKSAHFRYWEEALACSFDEHGVTVTPEQLSAIADDMEGAYENHGMAFYVPESPYPGQIKTLETALKAERAKILCQTCKGSGELVSYGPSHMARSQCWKCRGEGRHAP